MTRLRHVCGGSVDSLICASTLHKLEAPHGFISLDNEDVDSSFEAVDDVAAVIADCGLDDAA